jgi:hypothetical protein
MEYREGVPAGFGRSLSGVSMNSVEIFYLEGGEIVVFA